MSELKPCPCCNYEARLYQYVPTYRKHDYTARVKCNRCGLQSSRFSGETAEDAAAKAAGAWNARVMTDCGGCGYKIHSEAISKLENCNMCGKKLGACPCRPQFGDMCRINCPLWVPKGDPPCS